VTKRFASEFAGTYQFLVCQAVEAAQLSLPGTQAACCQVITFAPTKRSVEGEPAAARTEALWPISIISISPLRGQVCGLTPSIHAAGHKPVPSGGVLTRTSIMPYCTCTLPLVSILPEVKTLLPTVWFWARMASARVPDSKGTFAIETLFGL
jgi:hypothetical protein